MNKIIFLFILCGVVFLVFYWILNPLMGVTIFLICAPFLIVSIIGTIQVHKSKKEVRETAASFQREKEEIISEIRNRELKLRSQIDQLTNFGNDLATALNREQLLQTIVTIFAKATSTPAFSSQVFLLSYDPVSNKFKYESGHNFDRSSLKTEEFKGSDELLNSILRAKKVVTYISDIFGSDSHTNYFLKEERFSYLTQLGAVALLPLNLENEVWGLIVIFCQEAEAARIKNNDFFFQLLMSQASIALGNAVHRGLACIDRLTQLYNRSFFQKRLVEEFEFCNRQDLPLSLLMIDIDNFKKVNDTYGHREGDVVLKTVSYIISKNVRLTDVCARYGGEEFMVILPGIKEEPQDNMSIAERLRQEVEKADIVIGQDKHIKITISIGVAVRNLPEDKKASLEVLIDRADKFLYQAKRAGRNKVCYQT